MDHTRAIYRNLLEALYERALLGEVTPQLKQRLRPLGLDLDRPLPTSLSVPAYSRCLHITVEEIYPGRPPEEGMYALSRRLTCAYWDSPTGRASARLIRLVGPQRMLSWVGRIFRTLDSYSSVSVSEEGPRQFRVQTNAISVPPGFGRGVFEELLMLAGAHEPRVETLADTGCGEGYRVRWSDPPGG